MAETEIPFDQAFALANFAEWVRSTGIHEIRKVLAFANDAANHEDVTDSDALYEAVLAERIRLLMEPAPTAVAAEPPALDSKPAPESAPQDNEPPKPQQPKQKPDKAAVKKP
jgi:hypothetical protein